MDIRLLLAVSVLLLPLTMYAQNTSKPRSSARPQLNARQVHQSAVVIDTHADTTQFMLDPKFDFAKGEPWVHVTLEKARQGGLDAQFFSVWLDETYTGTRAVEQTLRLIDGVYQTVARHPNQMVMGTSTADIERHAKSGKLVALMGIEGGHAINNDLANLRMFHKLGVRYMTLTWANTNDWADASGDITDPKIKHHGGLTDFGRQVVAEMNRLGMLVDISHVSDQTFFDVMEVAKAPVIASHSSARALASHPRNMTDEMLRAVAKNRGVVMVNFFSMFLSDDFAKPYRESSKQRDAEAEAVKAKYKDDPVRAYVEGHKKGQELAAAIKRPPFQVLVDHIDHIAKVAGIDHVGLGSDFDGVSSMPDGMDSAADLPKITAALLAKGYSAQDVRKFLGGNILRAMRENERIARELQGDAAPKPRRAAAKP